MRKGFTIGRNVHPACHVLRTRTDEATRPGEGEPDRRPEREFDFRDRRDPPGSRGFGAGPRLLLPQSEPRPSPARVRRVQHLRMGELHRAHGVRVRRGRCGSGRRHLPGPADPRGGDRSARVGPRRPLPSRARLPARRGVHVRRVRVGGCGRPARRARAGRLCRRMLGGLDPDPRAPDPRGAPPVARSGPDRAHHGLHGRGSDREHERAPRTVARDDLLRARRIVRDLRTRTRVRRARRPPRGRFGLDRPDPNAGTAGRAGA